jgi:hypothetical protein
MLPLDSSRNYARPVPATDSKLFAGTLQDDSMLALEGRRATLISEDLQPDGVWGASGLVMGA